MLGVAWKIYLLNRQAFPFNADEAIVGLMARHILAGERPLFFYGQAYMGSLDAALVAVVFRLMGISVAGIRLVQVLLYFLSTILFTSLIWGMTHSRAGVWAAGLFFALPVVNTTLYTTVSLGGYGEALLIGIVQLLLAFDFIKTGSRWRLILWAFLTGLGLWVFGLTLIFSAASGILIAGSLRSNLQRGKRFSTFAVMTAAGLAGASPWLITLDEKGLPTLLSELFGSAIAGGNTAIVQSVLLRIMNVFLFGPTVVLGIRPPWSVDPLAIALLPFSICFWIIVGYHLIRRRSQSREEVPGVSMLGWITALTLLGLISTPFGGDPSGRYFLPLVIPLVAAGSIVLSEVRGRLRLFTWGLFGITLIFQIAGTLQSARIPERGITTQFDPVSWIDHRYDQELQSFLKRNDLTAGYTQYWVAYPLAFLSEEELIFLPWLPYHQDFRYTIRDDRYAAYREVVARSDSVAYITSHHPALNALLEQRFEEGGVAYAVTQIGDYTVFYNLVPPTCPEDLRLPWQDALP